MEIKLKKVQDTGKLYAYMSKLPFPYQYEPDEKTWEQSYLHDTDGNGKILFSELETLGGFSGGQLEGFIQYGKTAFGFDGNGELSDEVSYPVIRSFYFSEGQEALGNRLLKKAVNALSGSPAERIYAFFHYFGMTCCGRHGKLSENFPQIHRLLLQNGFLVEHENVFYSAALCGEEKSEVKLNWHGKTPGNQQSCDFLLGKSAVGGCEVHFLKEASTAYLRWIFVNDPLHGKGIGSECMAALKTDLLSRGMTRLDTDTALSNTGAQRFYEKNGFANKGLTRSYYKEPFDK